MRYWLMKSEPCTYSIDTLEKEGKTQWEGVRNYQARNFMRDDMRVGDKVLFYHSNAKPPGVAGLAEVCSKPYPDFTAWDRDSKYFSDKGTAKNPVWIMVDVKFVAKFDQVVSLETIKELRECEDMLLLRKGQRLSILPIDKRHYDSISKLGKLVSPKT
jgi:predicted RNA-binding protein with PUA-like domain